MQELTSLHALGLSVLVDPVPCGVRLCLTKPNGVIIGVDGIPTRRVYVGGCTVAEAATKALDWLGVEQVQQHKKIKETL